MKKLLLVVLAWMVLAGASRAQEGRAGDWPAEVVVPEPGMVTLAVRNAHAVAYRLAGRVLRSLITDDMNREKVARILGEPDQVGAGLSIYKKLGIIVCYDSARNAAGDRREGVTTVFFLD